MKKISTGKLIKLKKQNINSFVIKPIEDRFSPRNFSSEDVSDKDINSMFEAARFTPSARNRQPWFFYWAKKGSQGFKKICSCFPDYNQWSERAPLLILACYINEDDDGINEYALYDLGAAVISLIFQAQSLGYYARQVGSFDKEKAKKILKIEKNHQPFTVIVMGKIGDYSKLEDDWILEMDYKKRDRKTDLARQI